MKKVKFFKLDMIVVLLIMIIFVSIKIARAEEIKAEFYSFYNHDLQLTSGEVINLDGNNPESGEQYVIVFYMKEVKYVYYTSKLLDLLKKSEDPSIRNLYSNYKIFVMNKGKYGLIVEEKIK